MSATVRLLVIYVAGFRIGGVDTIEFTTEAACEKAKPAIVDWVHDQTQWGQMAVVTATCLEIEK